MDCGVLTSSRQSRVPDDTKLIIQTPSAGTSLQHFSGISRREFTTNLSFSNLIFQGDEEPSEDSNHHPADPKCHIIISLAQEHRRSSRDKKVK